jgi:hypothetical protein
LELTLMATDGNFKSLQKRLKNHWSSFYLFDNIVEILFSGFCKKGH